MYIYKYHTYIPQYRIRSDISAHSSLSPQIECILIYIFFFVTYTIIIVCPSFISHIYV